MATRLLLTLLALLTGLAAQLSPAYARVRPDGASEVGALAGFERAERAAVARPSAPVRRANCQGRRAHSTIAIARDAAVCVPTVLLRVDRAHE